MGKLWRVRNNYGTRLDFWPRCGKCNYKPVEAYGKYHEGSKCVEYWARCSHGQGGEGEHEVLRISWEGWSDSMPEPDVIQNQVSSLVFFAQDSG